jgi:hypothetical protein
MKNLCYCGKNGGFAEGQVFSGMSWPLTTMTSSLYLQNTSYLTINAKLTRHAVKKHADVLLGLLTMLRKSCSLNDISYLPLLTLTHLAIQGGWKPTKGCNTSLNMRLTWYQTSRRGI